MSTGPHAVLMLLQRAVYNGEDISLSRFEALAGKGDTKKWKASLSLLLPNGMPGQVWGRMGKGAAEWGAGTTATVTCSCLQTMQDWLDENRLDQRALDSLAKNAAEVQAWQEYNSEQGAFLVMLCAALAPAWSPLRCAQNKLVPAWLLQWRV